MWRVVVLTDVGSTPGHVRPNLDRNRPNLARSRPNLARNRLNSIKHGAGSANSARLRPNLPMLGRTRPNLARIWQNLPRDWPKLGRQGGETVVILARWSSNVKGRFAQKWRTSDAALQRARIWMGSGPPVLLDATEPEFVVRGGSGSRCSPKLRFRTSGLTFFDRRRRHRGDPQWSWPTAWTRRPP